MQRLARPRRFALRLWDASGRLGVHEVAVVAVSFFIYFFIRGAVVDRASDALANADTLIAFEQRVWLHHEAAMQAWVVDTYWMVKVLNGIYFWGHMPVVIAAAVWLWVRNRRSYVLTRNAFLASGAIAVVIYWLLPVAPPRLVPGAGLIDTMAIYDRLGYNAQETKAFVNPYAAVPSLHFGWSLLLGLVVARVGRKPGYWAFGIAWPVAMFLAVVMTGNHFIVDAIAGAVVSFAGLGAALLLDRRWPQVFARISGGGQHQARAGAAYGGREAAGGAEG